jgi:undecaprenyl-diphosphatase
MDFLFIIILAIIQGVAEFLPISSSAHLIIFRDLVGIGSNLNDNIALAFDVSLHLGTLLAILVYFFKDFLNITISGLTKGIKDSNGKLFWSLVIATIPAAIIGFLFENMIDKLIRTNYLLIAICLMVVGIIIYMVDKSFSNSKKITNITFLNAFIIGLMQALALIPGISRSGITITGSRMLGINREDAAKFSFYLSTPIILGAVAVTFLKEENMMIISNNLLVFVVGIVISFIVGILCIEFLLKYLKKNDFKLFMWYRIVLGLLVISYLIFK